MRWLDGITDLMGMSLSKLRDPSMEFSRQEYWSGLPFPSPGDLPNPRIKRVFPALAGILSRSGGEKGLRGSGAGTLGVPLDGTRHVGEILGTPHCPFDKNSHWLGP